MSPVLWAVLIMFFVMFIGLLWRLILLLFKPDRETSECWLLVFFLVLMGWVFKMMFYPMLSHYYLQDKLAEIGVPIEATVIDIKGTNVYINEIPEMKITFTFELNNQEQQAQIRGPIAYEDLPRLQPGSKHLLVVNPENSQEIDFAPEQMYDEYHQNFIEQTEGINLDKIESLLNQLSAEEKELLREMLAK